MEIYCKATKRFLMDIDIETYATNIQKAMNVSVKIPIVVKIPCKICKMVEVYEVYPTCYKHISSYKKN